MNQPVKNPQQRPISAAPQGNRPQGVRPAGVNPAGAGHPAQQGQRPMMQQQGMRPVQPQNRPMQPQQGRPMGAQGAPVRQNPSVVRQQPVQQRPVQSAQSGPQQSARAEQQSAPAKNPYVPNFASDFNLSPAVITTKGIVLIFFATLICGMIFGGIFFGGSSSAPAPKGVSGAVRNPDITTQLPRCGRTDPGQACVLYIMNSTRYDKIAEDFFEEAVKLTEIQKYSISMTNPAYAKVRIPPGAFAVIKIPNVR